MEKNALTGTSSEKTKKRLTRGIRQIPGRTVQSIIMKDNIASLTSWETYKNVDRYRWALIDINRVLEVESAPYGKVVSLAN